MENTLINWEIRIIIPARGLVHIVFTMRQIVSCKYHFISVSVLYRARGCIAIDCEMVGGGSDGSINLLARCSIVNHHGNMIYDKYVQPIDTVSDYRTRFSGIRPSHLKDGES